MNYAFLFGISKAGQVLDMVDQDTVKGRAPSGFHRRDKKLCENGRFDLPKWR